MYKSIFRNHKRRLAMENYHICYLIDNDLCTGITLQASSYSDALNRFNKNNKILYICLMR
jgi:hypothetical protein